MSPKGDLPYRRVGSVRPSQLMFTYGVGSLVDLPNFTAVVMGLDKWGDSEQRTVIREPRLLRAVQGALGTQVTSLQGPPMLVENSQNPFDEWARTGISVQPFPRWLRCSNPACSLLESVDKALFKFDGNQRAPHRARYVHAGCAGGNSKRTALPVRFVTACPNGHLDEFPWVDFCHVDAATCDTPMLKLIDTGLAARATDQKVECTNCGASAHLNRIFGTSAKSFLPRCRGWHPHLGHQAFNRCEHQTTAVVVGATNLWFPYNRGVLSLPEDANPLDAVLLDFWELLQEIDDVETLGQARRFNPQLAAGLEDFDDQTVLDAIESQRNGPPPDPDMDLLGPEWKVFTGPPVDHEDLKTRVSTAPTGHGSHLGSTVVLDRLREVVALCGFGRIDNIDETPGDELAARVVALTNDRPRWVPASQTSGEGLLVTFDPAAIQEWEAEAIGHDRFQTLRFSVAAWRRRRNLDSTMGLPSPRFALLHTFAHLLIHQIALECGYGTASLRERIYSDVGENGEAMAGVLVYTAAPDSEGTLGGLVSLAEDPQELGRIIGDLLARATLCSADPFCSEHGADTDAGTDLHNAACHSCLFLPETACVHGNRTLDRALVVPTLYCSDLAYISSP